MSRVLVGISGGVDSTASLFFLQQRGFDVTALFLDTGFNSSLQDRVRYICQRLDVPLIIRVIRDIFSQKVVDYFVSSYSRGITPNPCIICNPEIKFRLLFSIADELGFDMVSTGHYARIVSTKRGKTIARALYEKKDQSYFLYRLLSYDLNRVVFPLGKKRKSEVYAQMSKVFPEGFFAKESQDLCFIFDRRYKDWLKGRLTPRPGRIISLDGRVLAHHKGIHLFTPGQREGLGIKEPGPWYVVEVYAENGDVVVARKDEAKRTGLVAGNILWLGERQDGFELTAKIRYNQPNIPVLGKLEGPDRLRVYFSQPVIGVARGQHIVFYDGDIIIGGGEIEGSF